MQLYPIDFEVLGSSTGDFTGEETVIHTETGLTTGWPAMSFRTIAF